MWERNLEVGIRLISDYEFDVGIAETESGDYVHQVFTIDSQGEGNLRTFLGEEVMSWVEMMLEEKQEAEGYDLV